MLAELGTYGLSFIAGILSTLSPCVLPLVPILIGSAVMAHRLGPFALAAGLALSFTVVGVLIASVGAAIGLDQEVLRNIGAMLLLVFGVVLLSTGLQAKFAVATSSLSGTGQSLLSRVSTDGLIGQFSIGLLLGLVWSPCVGPTLGATITLASQGQNLGHAAVVMAIFGLGASTPLVILSLLSRQSIMKFRNKMMASGAAGKKILGMLLLVLGLLILTGWDKHLEASFLNIAPDWLVQLTTSI
ncbi:cytochrome c biogenesis CcdA family protein [Methylotenera mobilis]|uniref:Cytochrome c biogenesis protein transmembrane region n=1 Tax=Methylotenera mobilis (strain JLW8 / ATCC BAA-1282 / DSM 17540) TaxID=583345 RepID=C6WYQ1_METML|nr:cytochrome c biogenesis CcdA family protein [Methylotenera mobilis]ACT47026.1 cytochrome c biogenesis protein transmembrane region [Methylotenera mobilis JLW8]